MRKKRNIILIAAIILGFALTYLFSDDIKDDHAMQQEIASKIIRFHVIANSDSDEDQALKLKVKENIVNYIDDFLKNSKSV